MAKDRDIELDPRFLVPPGVIDVRQDSASNPLYENSQDFVEAADGPVLEFSDDLIPIAPNTFSIVSQTIRIGADGSTRVDVLLEFPDNPGVYDIDVRVTPV